MNQETKRTQVAQNTMSGVTETITINRYISKTSF